MKLRTKQELAGWAAIVSATGIYFLVGGWGYAVGLVVGFVVYDVFHWIGEWSA